MRGTTAVLSGEYQGKLMVEDICLTLDVTLQEAFLVILFDVSEIFYIKLDI